MKSNFDLLDFQEEKETGHSLGSDPPLFPPKCTGGYLLITFNYPHTSTFLRKVQADQEKYLLKIYNFIKPRFNILESEAVIELTDKGCAHLHAYMKLSEEERYVSGTINDYVKYYLDYLPKKYNKFNEANYYPKYRRFRCPSICVQYKDNNDNYVKQWISYMHKDHQTTKTPTPPTEEPKSISRRVGRATKTTIVKNEQ